MLIFAPLVIYWVVTLFVFVYVSRNIVNFLSFHRLTIIL